MFLMGLFQLWVFYDSPLLGGHLSTPAPRGLPRASPLSSGVLKQSHPQGQLRAPHSHPDVGGTAAPQRWTHGAASRGRPKCAGRGGSATPVLSPAHPAHSSLGPPESSTGDRGCSWDTPACPQRAGSGAGRAGP